MSEKLRYNVENHGDYITIGINAPFDIKANKWFNLRVNKRHIKDKSLDTENILDF